MARMLLLAEKPSVARAIAGAIKKAGIIDTIDVDAFHGHLMELAPPDYYDADLKVWSLDKLPFVVDNYTYLEKDAKSCQRIMSKIKAGRYDYLINACDAGREGDLIFYSFYWAHNLKIPVLRFWASDTTEKTLIATLKNLKPASNFHGYTQAAMYRARFDWLLGMNFSRAMTLKTGKKVNIGSVMTPTLAMIVNRELAIQNFKPEDYFEIEATFTTIGGENYKGIALVPPENKLTRFTKKADADAIVSKMVPNTPATIEALETKRTSTKAPTLYSLLELQKDAAKYFGLKADTTLEIAQKLYEAKYITYPRSECRFLPTAMVPEIMDHITPLEKVPDLEPFVKKIHKDTVNKVLSTKDYVDDAKLTDHHAIIPTDEEVDWYSLSTNERRIYTLIGKRLLSLFLGPYVVDKSVMITVDQNGYKFKTSGKMEVSRGFGELYPVKAKDVMLPNIKKGDAVSVKKAKRLDKQTVPPDRYTVQSILTAMQNAGNDLSESALRKVMKESAGLGTSATRAGILLKLEKEAMVRIEKTTYYPTEFGISVIQTLNGRKICSAELRAKWEEQFMKMEASNSAPQDFQDQINKYVTEETKDIIDHVNVSLSKFRDDVIGICPVCGGQILSKKNFFLCEHYKDSCNFFIPKEVFGASISDAEAKILLSGKATPEKDLTAKSGKAFRSALILHEGTVKPAFAVQNEETAKIKQMGSAPLGVCPVCGGNIYSVGRFYLCENRSSGKCQFMISNVILGASVTKDDAIALLSGKKTRRKKFTWKNGTTGEARLVLNGAKLDFVF